MEYRVMGEATGNVPVTYRESVWTGKREVLVNGVPAMKLDKRTFAYTDDAGAQQQIGIEGNSFTGVNLVMPRGRIQAVRGLVWWEYILIFLPMLLVVLGGLIGALCGILAAVTNYLLIRSLNNVPLKIILPIVISAIATVLYFVIAIFVLGTMLAF